jgi:xanthine dehydrogenase accessory factor
MTENKATSVMPLVGILAELTAVLERDQACVFCTVVETRGSTPQKAGATMLVLADGRQCGTLGGGCVEAEAKQRALHLLNQGGLAETWAFELDDNLGWDDGLICGGRMVILADPLLPTSDSPNLLVYFQRFRQLVEQGQGSTEILAVDSSSGLPVGSRFLFGSKGNLIAQRSPGPLPDGVKPPSFTLGNLPRPTARGGLALVPFLPRITLLLVGAGHVSQAVARLAAEVDFDVWVLDDRASYACRERFPTAERLLVGDIGGTLQNLVQKEINPSIYCIIVTRGHVHDEEALYYLAPAPAGYVGMIGSKRKVRLIFEDLQARGIPPENLARVHSPLGIDIGSQTVPEIAISILAELIACRNLGHSKNVPDLRGGPGGGPKPAHGPV